MEVGESPRYSALKKLLLLIFGGALLLMLVGCTRPDFRTFSNPVMTTDDIQAEMERLHRINLTVSKGGFDPSPYPVSVGVDLRNGRMLVAKFICWDVCPDVGMVFLLYMNVESEAACSAASLGTPLISPEPIPGDYWGCRPIVDWLDRPARTPS